MDIDFSGYRPINEEQEQYHNSTARHKLLVGGVGSGKTYSAIHDSYFHCYANPGHNYLVCRNTWDLLEDGLIDEYLEVGKSCGAIKDFEKSKSNIILHNDLKMMFRPLSIGKKDFKGMHLCGFHIDDPNTQRFYDDISFLWTRLRNPPNVFASSFKSTITANWEGRDWLWKTFIKDREQGVDNDGYAYWILSSDKNPTLPKTFISDMATIHSKEWMDRYIYMKNLNVNIGLIYHMFDPAIHHMSTKEMLERLSKKCLAKIRAIDVGSSHPTVTYNMATDGENIYAWDESYKRGWGINDLGVHLRSCIIDQGSYSKMVIDPNSARNEMTSKESIKSALKKFFGINTYGANNDVTYGISMFKDLLKPSSGKPKFYIDCANCPEGVSEFGSYRYKEPQNMDMDDIIYTEEPVKKRDDCMDCLRYGVTYLIKYLRRDFITHYDGLDDRQKKWFDRATKLKYYSDKPRAVDAIIERYDLKESFELFKKGKTKNRNLAGRYGRLKGIFNKRKNS